MTTTVTATCACRAFTYKVDFPNASLPIDRALCLCNGCRRISGSCGISYIVIPQNHTLDPSNFNLTAYKSSEPLTRYFCSTCGAHAYAHIDPPGGLPGYPRISLATGLWNKTEGIIKWNGCKWVEDTLDGGVSIWFNEIVDADGTKRPLKRWMLADDTRGEKAELVPENSLRGLEKKPPPSDKLKAQCHCGGVKFYITRPNAASKKVQSPFPDLSHPFHFMSSANPDNETWFLRDNDTKYLAGTCACTSCRQSMGFEIQTWAFVPECNIFKEDGSPLDFNLGTLKTYPSSEGVTREFCSKCGATVFWHCEFRPELIDVSAGLLDPEEGARVEGWLNWWTDRVSFEELAVSRSLVTSLEDGLKEWGKARQEA